MTELPWCDPNVIRAVVKNAGLSLKASEVLDIYPDDHARQLVIRCVGYRRFRIPLKPAQAVREALIGVPC